MSAKINNFINLGIGNAGDGSESLPVYGIYWDVHQRICIFELDDINTPFKELDTLICGGEPEFKKLIFDGRYLNDDSMYIDSNTGVGKSEPYINIYNLSDEGLVDSLITINDYGDGTDENLFTFLDINKGIIIGHISNAYTEGTEYRNFYLILNPGETTSDTYDGFGTVQIMRI